MSIFLKFAIFGSLTLLAGQLLLLCLRYRGNMVGVTPIPWPLFFLSKFSVAISLLCVPWQLLRGEPQVRLPVTAAFLVLWIGGTLVLTSAFHRLGTNLRVGLPSGQSTLVTSGMYRFSRNPIYLGIFCLLAASLVYALSWLNLVSVFIAVALHHRIILAEERFLTARFPEYGMYRKAVRRYL